MTFFFFGASQGKKKERRFQVLQTQRWRANGYKRWKKKNPVLKHQAACYTESNMKSEKGWNPEKKKLKKKRGERYEKRKVWGGSQWQKKITERTSPPQTLPRCYHWHSLRKKKKSNGTSRTRKWPRQISTKKKGRGLTGNYLGWLRHSLHNIGCDSPKKKNFVRPYSVVCQIPLRRCYHCWSTAARPIRQQKGMLK